MQDRRYSVLYDKIMVEEYMQEHGIPYTIINRPSGRYFKTKCPSCGEDDFIINVDTGSFNCIHKKKCGIHGSFAQLKRYYGDGYVMQVKPTQYNPIHVPDIQPPDTDVGTFLREQRHFKREVYFNFKDILGRKGDAICFLYKKNGQLYSVKYRSMNEKKFWKEPNTPPLLYNYDACENKEDLFIVEGELDVIAAKHYGIDAVSIPNGSADEGWIEYNWDYIQKHTNILLIYDNDEAGQKVVGKIAKRIGIAKCINVTLPYKDFNECLINGVSEQEIYTVIAKAKPLGGEYVKSCAEYSDKVKTIIANPYLSYGIDTPFEQLTAILKGWRDGEVTIWTGINGSGKSNILLQVALDLCQKDKRVLIGSFEMLPERYLKWMAQMRIGNSVNPDEYEEFLNALGDRLFCINRVGKIAVADLMTSIEYAVRRYAVEHVIIDSLMRLQYRTQDIYKEQSDFVVALCSVAQEYNIHIHLVAHPRKGDSDIDEPDKVDVAGAYDITNNAHNVIVVHRIDDNEKIKKKLNIKGFCNTVLSVKKNREHGTCGRCALIYNEETKTFCDA